MPKLIDLSGKTFNYLTVLYRDTSNHSKHVHWICRCRCSKIVSVAGKSLVSGNTKSCGCYKKEIIRAKGRNAKDITGETFGYLKAIEYVRSGSRGAIWKCQCLRCGNMCEAYVADLSKGNKKSCGCLEKENQAIQTQKLRSEIISNTNVAKIRSKKPYKSNKSGIRGVCWIKAKQKWNAYIYFQGHHYNLGDFSVLDKAVEARKEAEENIFGDFLKWYESRKELN